MAFLKKPRVLPSLLLCGTPLPWVYKVKHLGNLISNTMDGNQLSEMALFTCSRDKLRKWFLLSSLKISHPQKYSTYIQSHTCLHFITMCLTQIVHQHRMISNTSNVSAETTISVEQLSPKQLLNPLENGLVRFQLLPVPLAADVKGADHTIEVDIQLTYLRLFHWWAIHNYFQVCNRL